MMPDDSNDTTQKLSDNPEMMDKLVALSTEVDIWHREQQEKIARQVILISSMKSPMESVVDNYLSAVAGDVMSYLDELKGISTPEETSSEESGD